MLGSPSPTWRARACPSSLSSGSVDLREHHFANLLASCCGIHAAVCCAQATEVCAGNHRLHLLGVSCRAAHRGGGVPAAGVLGDGRLWV